MARGIHVNITGDATDLEKAAHKAERAVGRVDKTVGNLARDKLGPLGGLAQTVGVDIDDMGSSAMAAGAAVAGFAALLASGVRELGAMTDEVRKFRDASGLGWETSSRLVATMDDLGISADTGAAMMGRLAKNIDAGKLDEFGLAAATAADGTVDMAATLGLVADRLNATTDPTKRAAIGTALFGKSWADLVPYLEQGSAGIRAAMADVRHYQIVSEETAAEQRSLALATDALGDAWAGLKTESAKSAVPALTNIANGIATVLDWYSTYDAWLKKRQSEALEKRHGKDAAEALGGVADAAKDAATMVHDEGEAAEYAAAETLRLANAERIVAKEAKEAARQHDEMATAVGRMTAAVELAVGGELGLLRAQMRTAESTRDLAKRRDDAAEALDEFGEGTEEAAEAQRALASAELDVVDAVNAEAQAEADRAKVWDDADGVEQRAVEHADLYRAALRRLAGTISDPAVKGQMADLLGLLDAQAAKAAAAAGRLGEFGEAIARIPGGPPGGFVEFPSATGDPTRGYQRWSPIEALAAGGPVSSGETVMVGERGPELFTPQRSGTIVPNGMFGGGGSTVVINVNSPIGRPDDVARWIQEQLRRLDRGQR